jgi:uncharacterized protein YciI
MFIVLLTYVKPLDEIDRHVSAHREWLKENYARGVFLVSGPRNPRVGGAIIAHGLDRDELEAVLAEDPFRQAGVATYEIIEVAPSMADGRLPWLTASRSTATPSALDSRT